MFGELAGSDVTYTNSRGVLSRAMAEFALGMILDLAKDVRGSFRLQQEQRWQHRLTRTIQGRPLLNVVDKTLGFVPST
ncbi:MAG: hydroxyacid dehydrogenase [Pseudarthrobacter sp.]|nr:hydroxyacid dehydrogenase [Pseudarthrobacter sp.]